MSEDLHVDCQGHFDLRCCLWGCVGEQAHYQHFSV